MSNSDITKRWAELVSFNNQSINQSITVEGLFNIPVKSIRPNIFSISGPEEEGLIHLGNRINNCRWLTSKMDAKHALIFSHKDSDLLQIRSKWLKFQHCVFTNVVVKKILNVNLDGENLWTLLQVCQQHPWQHQFYHNDLNFHFQRHKMLSSIVNPNTHSWSKALDPWKLLPAKPNTWPSL